MRRIAQICIARRSLKCVSVATTSFKRFASTGTSDVNPVDVENFTLNEEIVKRHMEIGNKWSMLGEQLVNARSEANHRAILELCDAGMTLLAEVGPMDSPVQCEANLLLEKAQAHFNLREGAAALDAATKAKVSLKSVKDGDAAKIAEVDEFIGHVYLLNNKPEEAEKVFRDVLSWIDVDSRKAMPMVAVAATNQRRTVVMGVGLSLKCRAEKEELTGGDAKPLYAQALDILVESLNLHIEANDFATVKDTLKGVVKCFVGVGDIPQAVATCEKYVSWCSRHNDEEGVRHGELLVDEICTAHKVANPLKKAKAE